MCVCVGGGGGEVSMLLDWVPFFYFRSFCTLSANTWIAAYTCMCT